MSSPGLAQEEGVTRPAVYPGENTWRMQVVDKATEEPVAGARIRLSDFGRHDFFEPGYWGPDLADFERKHVVSLMTNADGFAQVPRRYRYVQAHHGDLTCTFVWPTCGRGATAAPKPIAYLEHSHQQKVLVLNADGKPAPHVRVGITDSGITSDSQLLGLTNERGMVTIPISNYELKKLRDQNGAILAQTAGLPPTEFAVGNNALPGLIQLQLPDAPSLTLEFLDPLGQRIEGPLEVRLGSGDRRFSAGIMHGLYEIPAVGPGSTLSVMGFTLDGRLRGYPPKIVIPADAKGHLHFSLELDWDAYAMQGRLFGPDGKPLAHALVHAKRTHLPSGPLREDEGPWDDELDFITDESGHFSAPNETMHMEGPWKGLWLHTRDADGKRIGIHLPEVGATERGPLDLGDLHLFKDF